MDAIEVDGLRKRYGDVQALDGVGFAVREGEIFGLLGPNGAGKSTTIRVLATLTTPDEGRASSAATTSSATPNAVRRTIGYVPQDSGVDQNATGRENLLLQGRIQGLGGTRAARARRGAARARRHRGRRRPHRPTYSGGMRRRLDIALGLIHRPRCSTSTSRRPGLDPEVRASMWEEVRRLATQEQLTILLTTHYLEEADELAQRSRSSRAAPSSPRARRTR